MHSWHLYDGMEHNHTRKFKRSVPGFGDLEVHEFSDHAKVYIFGVHSDIHFMDVEHGMKMAVWMAKVKLEDALLSLI